MLDFLLKASPLRARKRLMHPSAWKGDSPKFADAEEFYKRILSLPNA
jgi:hypothetical protein